VIRSIVVGTDGSETATEALRQVAELAHSVGAKVHVVSAYAPAVGVHVKGAQGAPESASWQAGPEAEVAPLLEEASGMMRTRGVECECYARRGDPAEAILDVAEEQSADLIAVGNRGMRGTRRFLLGSVPDKISHHAPCAVLIVRTT
jgi:nucleotide-binding universal stress UspA family protein